MDLCYPPIRRSMSFSRKQQILFRPLVLVAWKRGNPLTPYRSTDAACRAWYEEELHAACEKHSTLDCDPKRDFERVMAHFESVSGGSPGKNPFYWNERIFGGDKRRIIHEVQKICRDFDCDELYMRGIARRSIGLTDEDPLPMLDSLSYEENLVVMRAIKIEVARLQHRGEQPRVPVPDDNPF